MWPSAGKSPPVADPPPSVLAVIVTYASDLGMLEREIESLRAQTYPRLQVQVVDNASANVGEVRALTTRLGADFLPMPENRGIPKAINTAARASAADYLLALNNDILLEPAAVAEMAAVAAARPKCAAVAPKTYLAGFPGYFDNVGTLLNERYSAYNRGIGEPDIGQYDVSERTFGACFAATLLHRETYLALGGLEETLFAYYEDVDWSYRAHMRGYEVWTAPKAGVTHHHSHAWQKESHLRKYYFIQRNLLRSAMWNLRPRALLRTLFARYSEHARRLWLDPTYRGVTLDLLAAHLGDILTAFPVRRRHQAGRVRPDHPILQFSYGSVSNFDPVAYRPEYTLTNLLQAYTRLSEVTLHERHRLIAEALKSLHGRRHSLPVDYVRGRLTELLMCEPPIIQGFLTRLEPDRA